ncbi:MAG: aminotransferase class V-fold PLP-dependent enzyme [Microthrixaceae bacterium]
MSDHSEDAAAFPAAGTPVDELLSTMRDERADDLDWRGGKAFSLVYNADDPDLERLQHDVAEMFLHENALNPFRYRTLLHMEGDIVEWASALLGAPPKSGSISSGGTESIFLAVQVARDEARSRGILKPTILAPDTAHPAFEKACKYLDVERIRIPLRDDLRADPAAFEAALDERTILLVGSAPCYPYGVIDPIPEIAAIAADAGVLCHVDACLGGWLLPFWKAIGREVPPFDLSVPGVTSLSADIHKYGYAYKGASVILYSSPEYVARQTFMYDDWPGGLYASRTTAGTRPGGPIAGAWATIAHLGQDGYERQARRVAAATDGFRAAVEAIDGIRVTGAPDLSVFEISTEPGAEIDLEGVAEEMDARNWALDRQQGGLHVMLSPGHDQVIDTFADDLAASVAAGRTGAGADAVYGSVV